MMDAYTKYLEIIDAYLAEFFEQQRPYIFCKEGCSSCCESGVYPFSQLEFNYLMMGFENLSEDDKVQVLKKIKQLKTEKENYKDGKFLYACPFLINNCCSVYDYRALICRSYGLASFYTDNEGKKNYQIPFCVSQGLNYSSVYDEKVGTFTTDKWKKSGIEVEPVSHNVSLEFLANNDLTQHLGLELNMPKSLIDWF